MRVFQEESERENSAEKQSKGSRDNHFIRRKKGYLGVGGANSQNVGLNVRAMQEPLLFKVPSIKEADGSNYVLHGRFITKVLRIPAAVLN